MSATTEIDGITWFQDNDKVWRMSVDEDKLEKVYYDSPISNVLKGYKHKKQDAVLGEKE